MIVLNIPKPKRCALCKFCRYYGGCQLQDEKTFYIESPIKDCPILEIPEELLTAEKAEDLRALIIKASQIKTKNIN